MPGQVMAASDDAITCFVHDAAIVPKWDLNFRKFC